MPGRRPSAIPYGHPATELRPAQQRASMCVCVWLFQRVKKQHVTNLLKCILIAATNQVDNKNKSKQKNWKEPKMINMILWKVMTKHTKKSRSKTAEAPSITYDLKWLPERTHSLKEKKTSPLCLINRINNIELAVDWWSLQNGKVTWRQASSQSQARAWGTLSKLQTGDSFICNTEEPVYSRVHKNDTHGLQHLETTVGGFNWCAFRENRHFLSREEV